MQNLQQQRVDVEAAQKAAREAQAWLRWISDPENTVVPCEANRLAAITYLNGEEMTVESLTDSFQSPGFRAMLAFVNPQQERAESLATIKHITGEIPVTAKYETNETLAKRAAELEERRELSKKSPAELRAIIKQNTPAVVEDDLPAHMDRAFLLGLTKQGEFKKVCERYGVAAVTRALNTRK